MTPTATILFRPILPVPLLALVVIGVGAFIWYTYTRCALNTRQRLILWGFRMTAILVIAWLLLQAERRKVDYQQERPVLAIAVDASASMTEDIAQDHKTRAEKAIEFLTNRRLTDGSKKYRVFRFRIAMR